MPRDLAYVLDILLLARDAQQFIVGMDWPQFTADRKTQFAVVRCLEMMGGATRRLSDEFRASHADIPWNKMAGMRNILIHEYDRVDYEIVWRVVIDELPKLIPQLERLAPVEGSGEMPDAL